MNRTATTLALLLAVACAGCAPRNSEIIDAPRYHDSPAPSIVNEAHVTQGIAVDVVEQWRLALVEGVRLLRRGDASGREIVVAVLREMYRATAGGAVLPSAMPATPSTEDNADIRGVLKRKDEAFADMNREDKK